MSVTVTSVDKSLALVANLYNVTGLVDGANTVALPTPPAQGSFPPLGDWTPTVILCFPYQTGAIGSLVTPDLTTIVNTNGAVTFTLYAGNATDAFIVVY